MTPFKNRIHPGLARQMARLLAKPGVFDPKAFLRQALPRDFASLELMQRADRFADALKAGFRLSYPRTLPYIIGLSKSLPWGLGQMPLTRYVDKYGQGHFDLSLAALKALTPRFSSEFAVRSFLEADPRRGLKKLKSWLSDPDEHVRRWVSEGTRPRLPWGRHLDAFKKNPSLTLPLLEALKSDPSPYVRKSVANHLNDIGKDHPGLLIQIARRWLKSNDPNIAWICRHACRNLIKQGKARALKLFGAHKPVNLRLSGLSLKPNPVPLGRKLVFEFSLKSSAARPQKLVVDYVLHFPRSSGRMGRKVFKLRSFELSAGQDRILRKSHSIADTSVRRYCPGRHVLEIQVNGRVMTRKPFFLVPSP